MTDTHTHLYLSDFEEGGRHAVERALSSGVNHLVFPNVNIETIEPMKRLHSMYPAFTSMAMGLHPTDVKEDFGKILDVIEDELKDGRYVAVGEVGMDLYWDKSTVNMQREAFSIQLEIADQKGLPVIIHCREALQETLDIIDECKPSVPLIFHSFTGSPEDVKEIRKICDPYFGINGVVTYKNAPALREAVKEIGISRLLLETDSPYLTPMPHRGKRNESSYLCYICGKVAECLGISEDETEKATDENAGIIFRY